MSLLAESNLIDLVVNWVREYKKDDGQNDIAVTAETDLVGSGLMDSYGMVDLLLFIESQVGCKIDLTDADPAEFSVVRGICRMALSNHQGEPAHARSE